jgi:hypothetical protein
VTRSPNVRLLRYFGAFFAVTARSANNSGTGD